jgi:sugar-specific transcriptional regulator TrmB
MATNEKKCVDKNSAGVLQEVGFSEKEEIVYNVLLNSGQLGIGAILKQVPYKRGDLYNILYDLRDKGVIEQTIKNSRINFKLKDPYSLVQYVEQQKNRAEQASSIVDAVLPELFEKYNLLSEKPSVTYLEGNEGIQKVYDMVNNSGDKENLLMRSIFDNDDPEEQALIDKQKAKQRELGIKTRFLSPLTEKTKKRIYEDDAFFLVERRIMQKSRFSLPAQIRIWANTVAIISMRKTKIITVIENKDIADTFRIIFEYMWKSAEPYHNKIVAKWAKTAD